MFYDAEKVVKASYGSEYGGDGYVRVRRPNRVETMKNLLKMGRSC